MNLPTETERTHSDAHILTCRPTNKGLERLEELERHRKGREGLEWSEERLRRSVGTGGSEARWREG